MSTLRKRKPKTTRICPRYPVDTEAIRRLALTLPIARLAPLLGISKDCLYDLLEGKQPRKKPIADIVAIQLRGLMANHGLVEIVTRGLNHNGNSRLSVRTDQRGPLTRYLVLRYPLGEIDQRYDATAQTLTVWSGRLRKILQQSSFVQDATAAEQSLEQQGLITRLDGQQNLSIGCSLPTTLRLCHQIDLTTHHWAILNDLCQQAAQREDPAQSGVVIPAHQHSRLHY